MKASCTELDAESLVKSLRFELGGNATGCERLVIYIFFTRIKGLFL